MRALKPFDYSHDGIHALHLEPGDDASDVPADAVPGLIAEGYVEGPAETKVIEAAPETGAPNAFDHDGDGKPGGAPKGGNRRKKA